MSQLKLNQMEIKKLSEAVMDSFVEQFDIYSDEPQHECELFVTEEEALAFITIEGNEIIEARIVDIDGDDFAFDKDQLQRIADKEALTVNL